MQYDSAEIDLFDQIHASAINNDPKNVIRLATDLRFVDSSRPYDTVCLNPVYQASSHSEVLTMAYSDGRNIMRLGTVSDR